MGVSVGRRSPNQNPVKSALDQIMGFMPMMYATRERNRRSLLDRMEAQHKADRGLVVPALSTMAADPTLTEEGYNQQIKMLGASAPSQAHRLTTPYEDFRMAPEGRLAAANTRALGASEGQAFGGRGSPFLGHVAKTYDIEGVVPPEQASGRMAVEVDSPAQDLMRQITGLQGQYDAASQRGVAEKVAEAGGTTKARLEAEEPYTIDAERRDWGRTVAEKLIDQRFTRMNRADQDSAALIIAKMQQTGQMQRLIKGNDLLNERSMAEMQSRADIAHQTLVIEQQKLNLESKYTPSEEAAITEAVGLTAPLPLRTQGGAEVILPIGWRGVIHRNRMGQPIFVTQELGQTEAQENAWTQKWLKENEGKLQQVTLPDGRTGQAAITQENLTDGLIEAPSWEDAMLPPGERDAFFDFADALHSEVEGIDAPDLDTDNYIQLDPDTFPEGDLSYLSAFNKTGTSPDVMSPEEIEELTRMLTPQEKAAFDSVFGLLPQEGYGTTGVTLQGGLGFNLPPQLQGIPSGF
jgi:hypothetical protein